MKGIFWNLHKKSATLRLLAKLVKNYHVHFVVLAECTASDTKVLTNFTNEGLSGFVAEKLNSRLRLFHRYSKPRWVYDDKLMSVRGMRLGKSPEVLLAMVHLPSKLRLSSDDQSAVCSDYIRAIEHAERSSKHDRTIIVGDFNMNPFEHGMVQINGFHAVSTRKLAEKGKRKVLGRSYAFFYNPMWRFFGDTGPSPGTWWKGESRPIAYFWHIYDQVLVRPALLTHFSDKALNLITKVGKQPLLNNLGRPGVSDHLPVTFGLEF